MPHISKRENSQIKIEHVVPAEALEIFFKQSLANFTKNLEFPGFRKGTAPENIVKEKISEDTILEDAAERAIKKAWPDMLKQINEEQKDVEIIGRPEVAITKLARGNPLEFSVVVSVLESFSLPDYKKIAKGIFAEKKEVVVTDEEIQKAIDYIKKNSKDSHEHDEKKLREQIEANTKIEKEHRAKGEQRMKALEAIAAQITIMLPDILVDTECERMIAEMKGSVLDMGMKWEDYLAHIKKTEEDLKKEWRDVAAKRARYGLILREIAKKENLNPTDEELEKQADQFLNSMPPDQQKNVSKSDIKEYLRGRVRNEMVFDFLEKA